MAVKQFLGEWKHEKSEGLDEFLKAMNVGFVKRNLAKSTSPTFIFEADGEKVKFIRQSVVMTQISMVEFGVERIEKNPIDGKDVRVTDTLDGDVWNTVTGSGVEITKSIVDGKLVVKQTFKGVTCTRTFVKTK